MLPLPQPGQKNPMVKFGTEDPGASQKNDIADRTISDSCGTFEYQKLARDLPPGDTQSPILVDKLPRPALWPDHHHSSQEPTMLTTRRDYDRGKLRILTKFFGKLMSIRRWVYTIASAILAGSRCTPSTTTWRRGIFKRKKPLKRSVLKLLRSHHNCIILKQ